MPILRSLIATTLLLISFQTVAAESSANSVPKVLLQTSAGDITLLLYPEKAPKSVANFLNYVEDGFYNNTIFHRVINDFMIQGGGYTTNYEKKRAYAPIMNEADNGLRNTIGTVAMARTSDPHSATAQFFINVKNNSFLDFREKTPRAWGYAVFGRVLKGMDVIAKIKSTSTGAEGPFGRDVPKTQIIIQKATIITAIESGEKSND
ncbi:MAG: peptidylprolyl isomerase [Chromatiales bacterium]|nr:peptidylprolyl isomerase [Chromatiales bacterium]